MAFISKGTLIFFPFTFTTPPSHSIAVVLIILSSFIEIASAPWFINSFIILINVASCINNSDESVKILLVLPAFLEVFVLSCKTKTIILMF